MLLVDDDVLTLKHWTRVCRRAGKIPLPARTPAQAIAQAQSAHPDTAVIDFFLEDSRATDVVRPLRNLAPQAFIVVVSGELMRASAVLAYAIHEGADDCQPKDVPLLQLLEGIESGHRPMAPCAGLMSREEADHAHLERVLLANGFNKTRAAEALGVSRQTIQQLVKRYGITVPAGPIPRGRKASALSGDDMLGGTGEDPSDGSCS